MRISKIVSILLLFGLVILLWQLMTGAKRAWVRMLAAFGLFQIAFVVFILLASELRQAFENLAIGPLAIGIALGVSLIAALVAGLRQPKKPKTWRETVTDWVTTKWNERKRK